MRKRKVNENFISRVFKSMRKINKKGNDLMFWLRDKLYSPILIFSLTMMFSPSTEILIIGKSLIAFATASTNKGVNVNF